MLWPNHGDHIAACGTGAAFVRGIRQAVLLVCRVAVCLAGMAVRCVVMRRCSMRFAMVRDRSHGPRLHMGVLTLRTRSAK